MASRGRKVAVVALCAGLSAFALFAPFVWRETVAAYYLHRLRDDPSCFGELLDVSQDGAKGRAVQQFVAAPEGAAALVAELATNLDRSLTKFGHVDSFLMVDSRATQSATFKLFHTALERAVMRGFEHFATGDTWVQWVTCRPRDGVFWVAGASPQEPVPNEFQLISACDLKRLAAVTRWLPFAARSRGAASYRDDYDEIKFLFAIEPLSPAHALDSVVFVREWPN